MALEFGRPKTLSQAWVRIPDRSHPLYNIQAGPYEHIAHFREFFYDQFVFYKEGKQDKLSIEQRMIPLLTEDIRLLRQVNSFFLQETETFTCQWGYIPESLENPWSLVLPTGDDEHRWWQITELEPKAILGKLELFSIETNDRFKPQNTNARFLIAIRSLNWFLRQLMKLWI